MIKLGLILLFVLTSFVMVSSVYGAASTVTPLPPTRMAFKYEVTDDEGIRAILLRYNEPAHNAPADIITNYQCPKSVTFETEVAMLGTDTKLHGLGQIIVYDCQHDVLTRYNAASFLVMKNGTTYHLVEAPVTRIEITPDQNSDADPLTRFNVTILPYDPKFDQEDEAELESVFEEVITKRLLQALIIIFLIILSILIILWWMWRNALGPFKKP
jgi:hypothetical protein